EVQRAPARFRAHILEVQARGIEYHVALNRIESRGEIRRAREGIFNVYAAGDAWVAQSPCERRVDLRRTTCVQIGNIPADQPQIQSPIEAQSHGASAGKLHRTSNLQIGVRSP